MILPIPTWFYSPLLLLKNIFTGLCNFLFRYRGLCVQMIVNQVRSLRSDVTVSAQGQGWLVRQLRVSGVSRWRRQSRQLLETVPLPCAPGLGEGAGGAPWRSRGGRTQRPRCSPDSCPSWVSEGRGPGVFSCRLLLRTPVVTLGPPQ